MQPPHCPHRMAAPWEGCEQVVDLLRGTRRWVQHKKLGLGIVLFSEHHGCSCPGPLGAWAQGVKVASPPRPTSPAVCQGLPTESQGWGQGAGADTAMAPSGWELFLPPSRGRGVSHPGQGRPRDRVRGSLHVTDPQGGSLCSQDPRPEGCGEGYPMTTGRALTPSGQGHLGGRACEGRSPSLRT